MHNHTFYTTSQRESQMNVTSPRLYLASGVTTIRTTGSFSPYSEINLKRSIESGEIAGPRMHVTGPYISGKGAVDDHGSGHDSRGREAGGELLGGGGRDLVQGLYPHLARRARGGNRRSPSARLEVHRAPLLGHVPRSGRPRDRRPGARFFHEHRVRSRQETRRVPTRTTRRACRRWTSAETRSRRRSAT